MKDILLGVALTYIIVRELARRHTRKSGVLNIVKQILKNTQTTMATQAEHAQALQEIIDQNEKARLEILAKITDLETAIENAGNTSPEVDEKMAALKASVQTDDDIVPDETEGDQPTE